MSEIYCTYFKNSHEGHLIYIEALSICKTFSFTSNKLLPKLPGRMVFPQFGLRSCFVPFMNFWQNYHHTGRLHNTGCVSHREKVSLQNREACSGLSAHCGQLSRIKETWHRSGRCTLTVSIQVLLTTTADFCVCLLVENSCTQSVTLYTTWEFVAALQFRDHFCSPCC